jgi:glycosyltransferase involved in cell wall biosynthesis
MDMAQRATCVTAVSNALAEQVRLISKVSDVSITPNCVDCEFWKSEELADSSCPTRYVTAGSLLPVKGFNVLLQAFKLVRSANPSATLAVAGDGPELRRLMEMVKTLQLGKAVDFLGAVRPEKLRMELAGSHCYVCSSLFETFGVAPLEALAAGIPVVSTKCGGPEDFIAAPSGLLVPRDDPETLAKGMLSQASGNNIEQRIHAYNVAAEFSYNKVGRVLEEVLLRAISI